MSYDVSLKVKTSHKEYEVVYIGNYTYNCSTMFSEAMGIGLRELDGMDTEQALLFITPGIDYMKSNPDKFKKMNPKNGWGDYESALQFIISIQQTCIDNPQTYISIS